MQKDIQTLVQDYIKKNSFYKSFTASLYKDSCTMFGIDSYALAQLAVLINQKWNKRLIVVTPTVDIAKELASDLEGENLIHYKDDKVFYSKEVSTTNEYNQRKALIDFTNLKYGIAIFSLKSFLTNKIAESSLKDLEIKICLKDTFDPNQISKQLIDAGYYRADNTFEEGSFSIRGEVMDIYPYSAEKPIRIFTLWGEVEKIAYFDPSSQKSEKTLSKYSLALLDENKKIEYSNILPYLNNDDYFLFVSKEKLDISYKAIINEAKDMYKLAYAQDGDIPYVDKILLDFDSFYSSIKNKTTIYDIKKDVSFSINSYRSYFGNVTYFKEEMTSLLKDNWTIFVLSSSEVQKERLDNVFHDLPGLNIVVKDISHGFSIDSIKLLVILDDEIFGRKRIKNKQVENVSSQAIDSFVDLKEGDYVVHVSYGVGQFLRIERMFRRNVEKDYIVIKYSDNMLVYVPIEQANLVQRFIGQTSIKPKLDKIGSTSWAKKKERAIKNARELAEKLVKLYAARQAYKGFAFDKDNEWQLQFESSFAHTETPDQLQCINDVKRDMESSLVSDRLICGDVGFGKTEIAFRAVFKAVMSGKQVAFLAPTTILAEQHYRKFKERILSFPIRVEQLSRIVESKKQKDIIKGLQDGSVDVVFGTHKIIQDSVKYNNLGLLVIDEEQRFGVVAKEKIKTLKYNIDCITLSATPIPRTLYMSLLKVRDMSLLTTCPRERQAIKTKITSFNMPLIVQAIKNELATGGQVFFLHNQIETQNYIVQQLKNEIPHAIIETAHGQMKSNELEDKMHRFIYQGIQVLVSTTIIENGIDIPNVNTIIINNAHMFGLSQLYQLRGRVGRSDKQAYCYLLYPDKSMLNEDSVKRLSVISEHTELGAGFKVALKDMEIRGAGNILGKEQSGELEAVGLDMYMKILEDEISRLEKSDFEIEKEVYLELDYTGYIPDEYLPDQSSKFELYKKIASVKTEDQINHLFNELTDRYGPPSEEVENLLYIAHIKAICRKLNIYYMKERNGQIEVEFSKVHEINIEKILNLMKHSSSRIAFDPKRLNYIIIKTDELNLKDKAIFILEILKRLL